ncbi:hypothetical protein NBRC116493_21490 [Aurantivibrio infirmus]
MSDTATRLAGKVTRLQTPATSPFELDKSLYAQIKVYVAENSWRQLAEQVKVFVRNQYKPAYSLVSEGKLSPDALEKEIKSHIPSRTYIEEYANGRPICYRYTNTLANFFKQEYVLKNHDSCTEFLKKLKELDKEKAATN